MAAPFVSVEAVNESQIQEVTLDGQEIYVQPLSMSENLTKLAHKIDFLKDESDEKGKPTSEGEKEEEEEPPEKPVTPFQPSLWPWDSVRNKLKNALTEVSVLLDVLTIAKGRHYMVLDNITQQAPESRIHMHVLAKKKAMQAAGNILIAGADKLKKSQESKRATPDFHYELLTLRKSWRLKKVGSVILGDLSYASAGSRFWQNGTFEVQKSSGDSSSVAPAVVGAVATTTRSALNVIIPSELEGAAIIQVAIKSLPEQVDLMRSELDLSTFGSTVADTHWLRKLEDAQNVIFCKEVFAQLAKEAVQVKSAIPHIVVGNQIFCHLFPGLQLSISLCHFTNKDKKCPPTPPRPEHSYVLEHSLHQLLREMHQNNSYHPMPQPVTGLLGMSKRRRLAGPHGFSRSDLMQLSQGELMLEQILRQARHNMIRKRAIRVIDELAANIQDPQIAAHWSCISSASEAMLKVTMVSAGYDSIRTSFSVNLSHDGMRAVCKDGRVIQLSTEEQELRDFILCQVAQHQLSTVGQLAKMMGWQPLSGNMHVGVGDREPVGNALSLMLASPCGDRVLSIRSGPVSGLKVSVQSCPHQRAAAGRDLPQDSKWDYLGGPFRTVHMDRMEGRNFINKIELLMACLGGTQQGAAPTKFIDIT